MTDSDNTQRLILFTLGESRDHQGLFIAGIWADVCPEPAPTPETQSSYLKSD